MSAVVIRFRVISKICVNRSIIREKLNLCVPDPFY